jgi:hypothetical protein
MAESTQRRFDYTAIARDHNEKSFTSEVEFCPGDELPISDGRWLVADVEEIGWTRWDSDRSETIVSRRLLCTVV